MKHILHVIVLLTIGLFISPYCLASSTCTSTAPTVSGIYQLSFHLSDNHLNPSRAKAGDVLGPLQLNSITVSCDGIRNNFSFQLVPNMKEVETTSAGKHVCDIGVSGVGVIWYDYTGSSIVCDHWQNIFVIPHDKSVNESGYKIGEVVRTSKNFEHPGIYTITIPDMDVNLNNDGVENFGLWGKAKTDGAITFLISDCTIVNGVKPVNFGDVNIDQNTNELGIQEFAVNINQCLDSEDRQHFVNMATFAFSSPTINSEGKIDNSSCEGCGQGIDIAIYDATNKLVDLKKKLNMNGAVLAGDTELVYQFKAVLEKNPTVESTEGTIDASMVIMISYY